MSEGKRASSAAAAEQKKEGTNERNTGRFVRGTTPEEGLVRREGASPKGLILIFQFEKYEISPQPRNAYSWLALSGRGGASHSVLLP